MPKGDAHRRPFNYTGMTADLAYLVGVFMGDGNVWIRTENGKEYGLFQVHVADIDFLNEVVNSVEIVLGYRPVIRSSQKAHGNIREQFAVRVCSTQFAVWLREFTSGKSIVPIDIVAGSREIKQRFIQGLMDSEGSITPRRYNKSGVVIQHPILQFGVKDEWIIEVREIMSQLGAEPGNINYSGGCFRFTTHPDNYVRAGLKFTIQRKQAILETQLNHQRKTRPKKINPRSGLGNRGSANGMSKLVEENIPEIRRRIAAGERDAEIAADYNVSRRTINSVRARKTWNNVQRP